MAEKFGLNGEVKELKIGRTFEKNNSGASAFHTVRYDFKPASVDSSREGVLTVDENKSVSITVPHPDGSGQTNFSGRVKNANPKECILIIDRETGEITIETLSSQILVKKTRPERNPDPPAQGSLTPTSASSTPAASFNSMPSNFAPASTNSSRSQMPIERAKPSQAKPSLPKLPQPKAPLHEAVRPSSPLFLGLPTQPEVVLPTMSTHEQQKITSSAAVLSESSSDSSSDDSSSSDSGSDNEDDKSRPASAAMSMPSFISGGSTGASANPPPSMPSFSSLSPPKPTGPPQGRMLAAPLPQRPTAPPPARAAAPPPPRAPSAVMSMPQFLNDDLQLSDDSD